MALNERTQATADRLALAVEGMTCGSCARTVERALMRVSGVRHAAVDLARGHAYVEGDARPADLVPAIKAAGYEARPLEAGTEDTVSAPRRRRGCC